MIQLPCPWSPHWRCVHWSHHDGRSSWWACHPQMRSNKSCPRSVYLRKTQFWNQGVDSPPLNWDKCILGYIYMISIGNLLKRKDYVPNSGTFHIDSSDAQKIINLGDFSSRQTYALKSMAISIWYHRCKTCSYDWLRFGMFLTSSQSTRLTMIPQYVFSFPEVDHVQERGTILTRHPCIKMHQLEVK